VTWPSVAERRAASDRLYERDPQRFAGEPSHFVVWALKRLPHHDRPLRILELGCGVGRDSRILASEGHQVRAVDHSRVAIGRARSGPHGPPGLEFLEEEALVAVARTPAGTVDVVYAHGLYMGFSEGELDELVAGVRRILSSGGHHLFAVRSTTDPHFGQGTEIAPDLFLGGPHGTPMRYYRRETLGRFAGPGLVRFAEELREDLALWYVGDRRA
jgi:SAM-dependent methyltransferase